VGVWGRRATPGQLLREGDRVEVCRPLLVDPKVARRERFQRQGARATGLFARRRPGGKQGY
jgi:putative ubiquitin-RnfH superfamily antitoxin RatB of RatAB toxin-antitoxin module